MRGFKSAILSELKNCQNGIFERLHGIQKKNFDERFLESVYEDDIAKKYS